MKDKNIEQLFNIAGYYKNTDDIDTVISDLEERIDYVFAKEKEAKESKSALPPYKSKPFIVSDKEFLERYPIREKNLPIAPPITAVVTRTAMSDEDKIRNFYFDDDNKPIRSTLTTPLEGLGRLFGEDMGVPRIINKSRVDAMQELLKVLRKQKNIEKESFQMGGLTNMQSDIQNIAEQGRFGDNMLMHVNPQELSGLAQLGALSYNPITGLPEAFKAKDLLPAIASFVGGLFGGPVGSAVASGATTAIVEQDITKGVFAGLSGFAVGQFLKGAGESAQASMEFAEAGSEAAKTALGEGSDIVKELGTELSDPQKRQIVGKAFQDTAESLNNLSATGVQFQPSGEVSKNIFANINAPVPEINPITGEIISRDPNVFDITGRLAESASRPSVYIPAAVGAGGRGIIESQEALQAYLAGLESEEERTKRLQQQYPEVQPVLFANSGGLTFQEGGNVNGSGEGGEETEAPDTDNVTATQRFQANIPIGFMPGFSPELQYFGNVNPSASELGSALSFFEGDTIGYQGDNPYGYGRTFQINPLVAEPFAPTQQQSYQNFYGVSAGSINPNLPFSVGPVANAGAIFAPPPPPPPPSDQTPAPAPAPTPAPAPAPAPEPTPAPPPEDSIIESPPDDTAPVPAPEPTPAPGPGDELLADNFILSENENYQDLDFGDKLEIARNYGGIYFDSAGRQFKMPVSSFEYYRNFGMSDGKSTSLKELPPKEENPGLHKLPEKVRNKMGFMSMGLSTTLMSDPLTQAVIAFYLGENVDDIVLQRFRDKYGNEILQDVQNAVKNAIQSNPQTEGLIQGNNRGGMEDDIGGMIGKNQPVGLSQGEFIIPADVVSMIGDGDTNSGAKELENMMNAVRTEKYGTKKQAEPLDTNIKDMVV